MSEAAPRFLSLPEVLEIHIDQLERYGGTSGVRDYKLLTSALAMPQAGMFGDYLHSDLFEMSAAYLFHIASNHPFLDGNKRTGLASCLVFLALNGVDIEAGEEVLVELVVGVATGKLKKASIAEFLRKHETT